MSFDDGKLQEAARGRGRTLLEHVCKTIPKENLHLPGGDFVDRVWTTQTATLTFSGAYNRSTATGG